MCDLQITCRLLLQNHQGQFVRGLVQKKTPGARRETIQTLLPSHAIMGLNPAQFLAVVVSFDKEVIPAHFKRVRKSFRQGPLVHDSEAAVQGHDWETRNWDRKCSDEL